jgi:hypothetical protein
MNVVTVECRRSLESDDDMEPRIAIAIASDLAEAERLCQLKYGREGFDKFKAEMVVERWSDGPARVLGYEGQRGAFTWGP